MKNLYNNGLKKQNIDYGDFPIIKNIKKSKYFKSLRMIAKEDFTYIDYNFEII
jgi:predicted aldo/keto reductase-like oxidoreductase